MRKVKMEWIISGLVAGALLAGACQPVTGPIVNQTRAVQPTQAESAPIQTTPEAAKTATIHTPTVGAVEKGTPTSLGEQPALPPLPEISAIGFASYQEPQVMVSPSIQPAKIQEGLANVYNPFVLSKEQIQQLEQEGFVVSPGKEKEFFSVYEKARYLNVPIFVTSDSLLHSYHLMFDKVLRTAEAQYFIPLLKDLNQGLLARTEEVYQALQGTDWEQNALQVVAFVSVGSKLLDPSVEIPTYAQDLVDAELSLIDAAAGIQPSVIFPGLELGEDYTQYIPRGHYTRSEELKAYFKSMMWYGRMTFRLTTKDPAIGRQETRSALLLVYALRSTQVNGRPALEAWADLYNPTAFFVGRSDDLTVLQYGQVMDAVYGTPVTLEKLIDEARLDQFMTEAEKLPPPKILGMVIYATDDEEETTKGMRFMGQRFVPDAYVFRQLIYRNVGTPDNRRGLPKGLDLLAAMGSERAYQILEAMGETEYKNYPKQMQKVRTWIASVTPEEWTETLYNSWLYSFFPLLDQPGEGYPAFMQSPSWVDKQLNTVLGSWAELKHDTILYAKQVYAEMGGGPPPPEPIPPRGYVEPVPLFYARLGALISMTRTGLEERGLLAETDRDNLTRLEELAKSFQTMAEKELRGEPLSEAEYETIRFYGGELEHLVMAAADSDINDPFAERFMEEEPQAAVIADVATDPDPSGTGNPQPIVLEEGVGRVNEIHVVVPLIDEDGSIKLEVAKGGVFSYYEFSWPAKDRLTDEKWREMLDQGQAPALPDWTESFRVDQGEFYDLQDAVHSFQRSLTYAVWNPDSSSLGIFEGMEVLQSEIAKLIADKQHIGKQLVGTNFTSFDIQSADTAVVNVTETWQDKLYNGQFPDYDEKPLATRGPYDLQATYTLKKDASTANELWYVSQIEYSNRPPEWESQ